MNNKYNGDLFAKLMSRASRMLIYMTDKGMTASQAYDFMYQIRDEWNQFYPETINRIQINSVYARDSVLQFLIIAPSGDYVWVGSEIFPHG